MKNYTVPQLEIMLVSSEDVIATSSLQNSANGLPLTADWDDFGLTL